MLKYIFNKLKNISNPKKKENYRKFIYKDFEKEAKKLKK